MASTVKIGLDVSDNGKLKNLTKEAKALSGELTAAQKAAKSIGTGMASGRKGPTKEENIEYRNARGVAGTGGGGSRDFAKQAQGLGGLVHLYATFAANIFAVSAAFMALDKAAQYEQMIQGAKALEATTGAALRSISTQMKDVTDGALSMQESLRLTSLGSAAGLSQKKILELTKGAKGASLALGRDMADSIDRVIRGVAKLEPELLDELGVVTRAQEAYNNYAKSIGISSDALTSYQKTVAYSSAVAEELNRKFGAIADKVPANPYAKFLGQLKDVGTELLTLVNKVITPVVAIFSNNIELIFAGVLLVVKSLTQRALPEIGKLFTVSPAVIKARRDAGKEIVESIKEANNAEIALAKEKNAILLAEEEKRVKKETAMRSKKVLAFGSGAFRDPQSKTATRVADFAEGVDTGPFSKRELAALKSNDTRAQKELQEIEKTGDAARIANIKERRAAAKLVHSEALAHNAALESSQVSINLKKIENARIESDILQIQGKKNIASQAEIDLAKNNLALLKMERDQLIQNAKYADPTGRAAAQVAKNQDALILDARRKVLMQEPKNTKQVYGPNKVLIPSLGGTELNTRGEVLLKYGTVVDGVSNSISKLGSFATKAVGALSTWGLVIGVAFEALSFGADALGLVNKKTDELNKTLEESTKVLEAATSAYTEYTYAVMAAPTSIDALIKRNTLTVNTIEQVSSSIEKQIDILAKWENESGVFTQIWDSIGESKFDQTRNLIVEQLQATAKVSEGATQKELEGFALKFAALKSEEAGTLKMIELKGSLSAEAKRAIDSNNNQISIMKDFTTAAANAGAALDKLNDKEFVKDANRRTVVEFLNMLDKALQKTGITIEEQAALIDKIPEGLTTPAGKKLEEMKRIASAIKAITDATAEVAIAARKEQEQFLGKFNDQADGSGLTKSMRNELVSLTDIYGKKGELELKNAQLYNKLRDDSISAEERLKTDAELKLNNLKIEFLLSNTRKELIRKQEMLDEYNAYESRIAEEKKVAALSWTKIFVDTFSVNFFEGVYNAFKKAFDLAQSFLPWWAGGTKGDKAPPKPPGLQVDPKSAALEGVYKAENERLKKELAQKIKEGNVKAGSKEEAALGNATKGSDKRSKALALQKEELKAQLEYLQAMSKYIGAFANDDERRLGYVTLTTLEAQKQNVLSQIQVRARQQETEIEDKYKKSKPEIGAAKADALREKALISLKLEVATEIALADVAQRVAEEKSKNLQYQQEILRPLENQLQLERDILDAKKSLGGVTPLGEIKTRFDLERRAAENALNAATQGIDIDTITVKNAKDKYNLTLQEISIKELVATKTQEIADAQERGALSLELSNMYLEDIVSRSDRFANAGVNSLKIQEQITTEYENQIKAIKLKNNPATEALEIEKATLDYITKQSDAYDKIHEARKRQLSETGKTADGTSQRQVAYDEARRQEDEFRKSLPSFIDFIFGEIYAGMDAAIESFVEKLATGQKIYFKDLISTFDEIVREESRKYVADQIKLFARSLVTKVFGGEGVKTKEERLEEYSKTAAESAKKALEFHSASLDFLENIDANIASFTDGTAAAVTKPGEMPGSVKDIEKTVLDKATNWIKDKVIGIFKGGTGDDDSKAGTFTGADGVPEGGLTAAEHLPPLLEQSDSIFTKIMDSFGELGDFMSTGLSKVFGEDGIFGNLLGSMGSGLSSVFGQLGSIISQAFGSSSGGGDLLSGLVSTAASFFFANGGIMSEYGPLKLNKYASGGIANTPQVAIFGEGSKPEAYVPLPDGRNIPVKMQEGNNQKAQQQQVVNVTNNFTVQGNTSRETQQEIARKVGMSINRSIKRNG